MPVRVFISTTPTTPAFFSLFFLSLFLKPFFTEFLFNVVLFCLGHRRVPSSSPSVGPFRIFPGPSSTQLLSLVVLFGAVC